MLDFINSLIKSIISEILVTLFFSLFISFKFNLNFLDALKFNLINYWYIFIVLFFVFIFIFYARHKMESTIILYSAGGYYKPIGFYQYKGNWWEVKVTESFEPFSSSEIKIYDLHCAQCSTKMVYKKGFLWYYWECPVCNKIKRSFTHVSTHRIYVKNTLEREIRLNNIGSREELNYYLNNKILEKKLRESEI